MLQQRKCASKTSDEEASWGLVGYGCSSVGSRCSGGGLDLTVRNLADWGPRGSLWLAVRDLGDGAGRCLWLAVCDLGNGAGGCLWLAVRDLADGAGGSLWLTVCNLAHSSACRGLWLAARR